MKYGFVTEKEMWYNIVQKKLPTSHVEEPVVEEKGFMDDFMDFFGFSDNQIEKREELKLKKIEILKKQGKFKKSRNQNTGS